MLTGYPPDDRFQTRQTTAVAGAHARATVFCLGVGIGVNALRQLTQVSSGEAIGGHTWVLDAAAWACCREVTGRLTDRQQEVLQLLTAGPVPQEVAARLGVGRKTMDSHKAAKLGLYRQAWGLAEDAYLDYRFLERKFGPCLASLQSG